jgi:hypothetical protein
MPIALGPGSVSALGLLLATPSAGQEQEPPHVLPRVETSRVVLEARVTDAHGHPMPAVAASPHGTVLTRTRYVD